MFSTFMTAQLPRWRPLQAALVISISLALAVASVCLTWVGFIESDDLFYAGAAIGWVQNSLFLGESHWALRHSIVLPMAALFRLFGQSETTLVLPSLIYEASLLALLGYMAWRLHGWLASAIAVTIAGTIPVIATGASLVSTDVPEAFFVIASFWAFCRGMQPPRPAMLLWSGVLAGVALITRETSVALIGLYAVLFVFGHGGSRRAYLWLGLGAAIVVGLDWLYLTSLSGDPLYRLHIAIKGVHGDGPQMESVVSKVGGLDHFGSLDVVRWLKPVVATFMNQNFGLFLWLAVPATVWLVVRGPVSARSEAALIGALALAWFVVIGYLLTHWLWVIPRYYLVCTVLVVPLAIVIAHAASVGRTRIALAAVALVAGSNMALNLGATTDLMAGERALATFAQSTTETIRTDPATERGARWLLDQHGVGNRVSVGEPKPGSLYFYNSRPRRSLSADWPVRVPPPGWICIRTFEVPAKWTHFLVTTFSLAHILPAGLATKLDPPPHLIGVYRAPAI